MEKRDLGLGMGDLRMQARLMAVAASSLFVLASIAPAQLAITGETVYTAAGKPIKNGVVLLKGKKIEKVGPASEVKIPNGYKVMNANVVTPGLVDAHGTIGLSGILNIPADQMQLEKSDPVQPELRAIDAYNAREPLVEWARNFGVTTVNTGHAPGALASGSTIVVKTTGLTVNEALIDSGMIAFTLGPSVMSNFKTPGTEAKAVAMLRAEFLKAQDYVKKKGAKDPDKRPGVDLKSEAFASILRGDKRILFTAQTVTDMLDALRLQKEFGFKMVLDGCAESYLLISEIKKSGVPVILHPSMARPGGDTKNISFETAAKLQQAGILFALQTGFEGYVPKTRVLLFEAAIAAANGLSFEEALASITISAAKILGLEQRLGSLEVGKDGDVVLYDGDPFEYTSHVCAVLINGQVVSEQCR